MLASLIPLFDGSMKVHAYSVFAQKQNYLKDPAYFGIGRLDGASNVDGLDIIDSIGMTTLSDDKEVFIELNNISIFADLDLQCSTPHSKIVLLINSNITPQDQYIERIKELKSKGYKFAIRELVDADYDTYTEILKLMDYILLDHKKLSIKHAKKFFQTEYPDVKLCAVNIDSQEEFDSLKEEGEFELYEGDFFRAPVLKGGEEVAPLKATYIQLINVVNDEDFELTKAADVIERDTVLVISLLKMVNRMTVNSGVKSVRHAAAMLGQKEMRQWINTAVTKELCADKPSEISRLSLQRAKFAQNLAGSFGLQQFDSELFLVGLFSVIDIILNKPMEEALEMVKLSKDISEAILNHTGKYGNVLEFIIKYEEASWQEVSRQMLLQKIEMKDVYDAYIESLRWYRDLFN